MITSLRLFVDYLFSSHPQQHELNDSIVSRFHHLANTIQGIHIIIIYSPMIIYYIVYAFLVVSLESCIAKFLYHRLLFILRSSFKSYDNKTSNIRKYSKNTNASEEKCRDYERRWWIMEKKRVGQKIKSSMS